MSELTLICEGCGAPVRRDSGGIYVTYGEINAHEAAMRDWRERHPEGQAVTLADLDDHPGPIPWRSAHDACTQDGKGDRYEIDAARIGTWQALASWTAHLMEKNRLAFTDWDDLLREVAGEIPARRIRVAAEQAA